MFSHFETDVCVVEVPGRRIKPLNLAVLLISEQVDMLATHKVDLEAMLLLFGSSVHAA